MSSDAIFLARRIGLYALLVALALTIHKQSAVDTAVVLVPDRPLVLTVGLIGLIAGLAIVLGHNVLSGVALVLLVATLARHDPVRVPHWPCSLRTKSC
jgi:Na+/phosphate symporter